MDPVVHFEMPYRKAKRAAKFYAQAFGWKPQLFGEDMGHYILMTTATKDAKKGAPAGAINGGLYPFKPEWPEQYPSVVIGVKDIKKTMKRIKDAKGKVLGKPMSIPGVGEYVSFIDTEGNRNSILQPLPMKKAKK